MSTRKVAFVTGGTGGLGKRLVLQLADAGYNIAFTYNSNVDRANDLVTATMARGTECMCVHLDVTNEESVSKAKSGVLAHYGKVHALINCAGIHADALAKNMDAKTWRAVIDVSLTGSFLVTKAFIPILEQQGYGRILNIGSVAGDGGLAGGANYAAAKAGLVGLTKSLALELAPKNITVNLVALGYIDQGMGARLPDKVVDRVLSKIPLRRFGDADQIARMVVHFVSEEAGYLTGQVIRINGGLYV